MEVILPEILVTNPKILKTQIVPPIQLKTRKGIFVGIDPGTTHLGIAVLDFCSIDLACDLFQVTLDRGNNPVIRVLTALRIVDRLVSYPCHPLFACIEGASFGDRYRQVELAEIRGSLIVWCSQEGFHVDVMPPLYIRKQVFGNGKIKARNTWINIPPDCADALACAYFSAMMNE